MTKDTILSVRGLSKVFNVYSGPRAMLKEFLLGGKRHVAFPALTDVSFDVVKGEAVGLMGRNGAGKSTLLRILAGTLTPTAGKVELNGTVSAILELGSGFNPEYSGRENILNGGLIMGLSKKEIQERMDEIIDFSELHDFIDQPFRTYSSGMQARLTFATAISVVPDILIVDESLSVGDAAFQAKCFRRIRKFIADGGSLFLVSHADGVITQFCDRAILMERGRILIDAEPRAVTQAYTDLIWAQKDLLAENLGAQGSEANGRPAVPPDKMEKRERLKAECLKLWGLTKTMSARPGSRRMGEREKAEVLDMALLDKEGRRVSRLTCGERYSCLMRAVIYESMPPIIGFNINTPYGLLLIGTSTNEVFTGKPSPISPGYSAVEMTMEFTCHLAAGTYFLTGNLADEEKIQDGFTDSIQIIVEYSPDVFTTSLVHLEHAFNALKIIPLKDVK